VAPIGSVFTASCPLCEQDNPVVAGDAKGAMLVAYEGESKVDDDAAIGRFYKSNGAAAGPAKVLSAPTPFDDDSDPAAAGQRGSKAGFAVAWTLNDSGNGDIRLRRFGSTGTPAGAEIAVSTDDPNSPSNDHHPSVAFAPDGGLAVAWVRTTLPGGSAPPGVTSIRLRRYNSSAQPIGAPIDVNTSLVLSTRPDVCIDSNGIAIVGWTSADKIGPFVKSLEGVVVRRVSAAGVPLGAEIVVQKPVLQAAGMGLSCGSAGTFVVAWQTTKAPAGLDGDLVASRYDKAGKRSGKIFLVNSDTSEFTEESPALSHDPAGNWVAVWSRRTDTETILAGRRFLANGKPDGTDFPVTSRGFFEGTLATPDVAHRGAKSDFVVVWEEDLRLARGQRYQVK
jgi:hypothetical protein